MSLNSSKEKRLVDAVQHISAAALMLLDLPQVTMTEDLQAIIDAANQAQQAVDNLRVLEGIIRGSAR